MTTETHERLWTAYLDAYGAVDAGLREQLLLQSVADEVVFTNPGGEGRTRDGLTRHIEDFQQKMPGFQFKTEKIFSHHGDLLAVWSMYNGDNMKLATGYNFVQCGNDGRFSYMAGFF